MAGVKSMLRREDDGVSSHPLTGQAGMWRYCSSCSFPTQIWCPPSGPALKSWWQRRRQASVHSTLRTIRYSLSSTYRASRPASRQVRRQIKEVRWIITWKAGVVLDKRSEHHGVTRWFVDAWFELDIFLEMALTIFGQEGGAPDWMTCHSQDHYASEMDNIIYLGRLDTNVWDHKLVSQTFFKNTNHL